MNIWSRRLELKKETRQAAISRRSVTQSNLSWNRHQTIWFLTSKIPAPDPLDMYPWPLRMILQSRLPKFLEKSDPEVARSAFSTWPVQKSQPKASEVWASIQIHQSAYRDRYKHHCAGQGCGFELPRGAIRWFVNFNRRASGSLFSRNFGRIELSFGWGMDTYLVDREPVFSR